MLEAWECRGMRKGNLEKRIKNKHSFIAKLISCFSFNLSASRCSDRSHVSFWAAGTETAENVCISAECCWSPGRGRGRQREPEREKAKWWELEQQQRLLPRCSSCPGIGSAASTPLRRRRCLRFKSPRRSVVLPGAKRSCFIYFFFSLFLEEHLFDDSAPFPVLQEVFCVINVSLLWKQVWDWEKNNSGQDVKGNVQRGGGLLFPPFYSRA